MSVVNVAAGSLRPSLPLSSKRQAIASSGRTWARRQALSHPAYAALQPRHCSRTMYRMNTQSQRRGFRPAIITNAGSSDSMSRQEDEDFEGEQFVVDGQTEERAGQEVAIPPTSEVLAVAAAGLPTEPPRKQEYKRLTAKEWRAIRLAHESKAEDLRHTANALVTDESELDNSEDDDVAGEGEDSRYWEEESWEEERGRREREQEAARKREEYLDDEDFLVKDIRESANPNFLNSHEVYPSPFIYIKPVCERPNEGEKYPRAQNLLEGADNPMRVVRVAMAQAEGQDEEQNRRGEEEEDEDEVDEDDEEDDDEEEEGEYVGRFGDVEEDEDWDEETEKLRSMSGWERMKKMWEESGEEGKGEAFVGEGVVDEREVLNDESMWWNWQKNEGEGQIWTAWQKPAATTDAAMAAAAAEAGNVKLHGSTPTTVESILARVRRKALQEERLDMEDRLRDRLGDLAYFQEWVAAWPHDTSKPAVRAEERKTGRPASLQLLDMLAYQTREEYNLMCGRDVRLRRDPLAMRMNEKQCKKVWGGDPVYPTVNYEQPPDHVVDYRGPRFHEPSKEPFAAVREAGRAVTREQIEAILAREQEEEEAYLSELEDSAEDAIDIGEEADEEEEEEEEEEGEEKGEQEEVEEDEEDDDIIEDDGDGTVFVVGEEDANKSTVDE